jgi:hypothetical protein
MGWAGHIAYTGEMKYAYEILDGKPEGGGKKLLGRPTCRLEDNIKVNLKEVGC